MNAEELDQRNRAFGPIPHRRIVPLLVQLGHVDVLEHRAAGGDYHCAAALARMLAEQGDQEAALKALAPFLATGWWPAVTFTASMLDGWGRTAEAAALVEPFAEAGDLDAVRTLARLLVRLGRSAEALDLLRPHVKDLRTAITMPTILEDQGHDAEIAALLEGMVVRAPFAEMISALARLYVRLDRMDEAVELLRDAMALWGGPVTEHVDLLAGLLAEHDRLAELEELAATPDCEYAAVRLARWHAARGDLDAAREVLRPFLEQFWPLQAEALAGILVAADHLDEAIAVLRRLALAEGDDPRAGSDMFFALLADHARHEEALAAIDEIAAGCDVPINLVPQQADFLRRSGRAEEALDILRTRMAELDEKDHPRFRTGIVAALRQLGRTDEAIAFLTPPRARDVEELAEILIRDGRAAEAMEALDAAYASRLSAARNPDARARARPRRRKTT